MTMNDYGDREDPLTSTADLEYPGRPKWTGSQVVVALAFAFLAAAIFVAVYVRVTGVDDVSIGMVGDTTNIGDQNGGNPETSLPTTTVAGESAQPATTAAQAGQETNDQTTVFTVSTSTLAAPVATGVPMKGVLRDGRVTLTGTVPDIEVGKAFTTLIEGFVGVGNVEESFTLDSTVEAPNSFTLQFVDNVLFTAGGETVAPEAFPVLDQIVSFMKLDANVTLLVEGHTDSTGDRVENLALSQRRADVVRSYLTDRGINEFRLEAQGKGDSDPVAENSTVEGREQNRRIELRLVGFQVSSEE